MHLIQTLEGSKPEPFEHQDIVLNDLKEAVDIGETSLMLTMASGTGKSKTAAFFAEWLLSPDGPLYGIHARILVICHQDTILEQLHRELASVLGTKQFTYGYCLGTKKQTLTRVVLASFQKLKNCLHEFDTEDFDLIIVDECHHSMAKTYNKVISYFQPKYLLGLTATPHRMDGKDVSTVFKYEVARFDLKAALEKDLLAKVEYNAVADADPVQVQLVLEQIALGRRYKISQLNKLFFIKQRDEEIVEQIKNLASKHNEPKTVVFCPTIAYAERIAHLLGNEATVMHSDLPKYEQEAAIAKLKTKSPGYFVVVSQLDEGVDVPDVNLIIFLRGTKSPRIFLQQLGRGLRKTSEKHVVYVYDFVSNFERVSLLFYRTGRSARVLSKQSQEKHLIDVSPIQFNFTQEVCNLFSILEKIDPRRYTQEELIQQLKDISKEFDGRVPTERDVMRAHKAGKCAGCHIFLTRFGSHNKALIAAGFEPNTTTASNKKEGKYTYQDIIEYLRELENKLQRRPMQKDIHQGSQLGYGPSLGTINRLCGSLTEAFDVIHACEKVEAKPEDSQADELRDKLQIPDFIDLETGNYNSPKFESEFLDGIPYKSQNQFCSLVVSFVENGREILCTQQEAVIYQLQRLALEIQDIPHPVDVVEAAKDNRCYSLNKIKRLYGSFKNAALAAGLIYHDYVFKSSHVRLRRDVLSKISLADRIVFIR